MLTLEAIHAGYGGSAVLRDVSLVVPGASVVALLGPNGAGKTTLLRVASGLLRPTAGRLLIDGEDRARAGPYAIADLGVCHVPEGRGIFRSLTVRENLLLFSTKHEQHEAIHRATDAFPPLGKRLGQLAGTLSGGEQQMLALARAYVRRPRLVLLDEVSMGLAPLVVEEIFTFLRRLAAEGVALLLVEQYVTLALEVAEYVYLLDRGRMSFRGEPGELDRDRLMAEYMGAAITQGVAP
jgi:branched-chain amino acid transport system ATP-binding protein